MATQTVFLSNGPGSNATYVGNPPDDDFIITDNGGNDTITLGEGTAKPTLLNGNNTLTTGSGNSNVSVGNGNDTITVGIGGNVIALGNGLDTVSTGAGNNAVSVAAAFVSGDTIMGALT